MNYMLRHIVIVVPLTLALVVLGISFFGGETLKVQANPPFTLNGYAWASADPFGTTPPVTGVGWVQFDHGMGNDVQISSSKLLSGYAWAGGNVDTNGNDSPFGWIHFGDNGCPANDADGLNCQPHIVAATPATAGWEMSGWARACTVFVNGCSGALKPNTERGGWDGWISLNCDNTNSCGTVDYAVRISPTGSFLAAPDSGGSFAWGDTVVNWMNFAQVSIGGTCSGSPIYTCEDLDSDGVAETSRLTSSDLWCGPDSVDDRLCTVGTEVCVTNSNRCVVPTLPTGGLTLPAVARSGDTITISWKLNSTAVSGCTVSGAGQSTTGGASGSWSTFTVPNYQSIITLTCDGFSTPIATSTLNVIPSLYES